MSKASPLLRGTVFLGAVVLASGAEPSAHAAPTAPQGTTRVHVRYKAPEGCGTTATFAADLVRRTSRVSVVDEASAGVLAFEARIEASGAGFVGSLRRVGEEAGDVRRLRAATCGDVASAIAFTLALSIDPDARAVLADLAPANDPATAPSTTLAEAAPSLPSPPPPPDVLPSRASQSPAHEPRRAAVIGLGATLVGGLFDQPLVGLAALVESRSSEPRAYTVRGRLLLAGTGSRPAESEIDVSLATLGVDACPLGVALGAALFRPCGSLAFGVARGVALRATRAEDGNAFILGGSLRPLLDLPLGAGFGLTFEGALVVTLVRPRFYLDPPVRTVAEARPLAGEGALSLWYRFP